MHVGANKLQHMEQIMGRDACMIPGELASNM